MRLHAGWVISSATVLAAWTHLRYPGGWPLAAAMLAFVIMLWPLLLLTVIYGLPGLAGGAVPRRWRMWWRHRHGRPGIPAWLRSAVYAADRYRCAHCGAPAPLQLDHVRPWSCGGLTSLFNMVTLCAPCNRLKSNYWAWPSGMITYRPFAGYGDIAAAAAILATERRARRNPLRWYRAAWALR